MQLFAIVGFVVVVLLVLFGCKYAYDNFQFKQKQEK